MKNASIPSEFTVSFKTRSYEVDSSQKATLSAICNYFQEAAGMHALELNFDISQLQEKGLTWVLYRMHVRIDSFPERWSDVTVRTWPSSGDGLRAYRDYELTDKKGNRLGASLSQWMVVQMQSRRPKRLPAEILEMGITGNEHVLPVKKDPVKNIQFPEPAYLLTVGKHDLDMNNHVNNVKYIEWVTGYYPEGAKDIRCVEIDIQYYSEAVYGDNVFLATNKLSDAPLVCCHTLYKNDTDHVLASAVTTWMPDTSLE